MSQRSRLAAQRTFLGTVLAVLVVAMLLLAARPAAAQSNVLFIFDSSGSMRQAVEGGETRMTIAKRAVAGALKEMPKDARLGLLLYGHRRAKDCKDIELVSPIASEEADALAGTIAKLQPLGETPIAASLQAAARSFAAFKGQNNVIVLVTDGIEECGGDPCAAARAIKSAGLDVKAHIVGFTLDAKQRAAVECVAKETGGQYFDAKNASGLRDAMQSVRQVVTAAAAPPPPPPPPPPPERFDLLARKNGGEAIFMSGPDWAKLNDESFTHLYGFAVGNEGVFAFREGRAGSFDTIAVYIPGGDTRHPREIEVLAGDQGPAGAFNSLGVITIADGKMRDGWQEFKLPQTTARFVKLKILSNHGGNGVYMYEVRLYGELAAAGSATAAPAAAATTATLVDLMSPQNGGEALVISGPDWKRLSDNSMSYLYGFGIGDEAIYAFRDGRAAALEKLMVYIPGQDDRHAREIEVLAGDEGPAGAFRSIAVMPVANGKMRDGWQEFKLPPTTAKFVKLKLLSNHGGNGIYLYEMRLMGELK